MQWLEDLWDKANGVFDKVIDVEVGRYEADRIEYPAYSDEISSSGSYPPASSGVLAGTAQGWALWAVIGLAAFMVLRK